jgi:CRP-like cAMP-binding protein
VVLARCGKGEHFGEQALIPGRLGKRTASVRAMGQVRLLRIEKAPFQALLAADHPLKEKLSRIGDRQLIENLAMQSRRGRALMDTVRGFLRQAGVPGAQINIESFTPAGERPAAMPPEAATGSPAAAAPAPPPQQKGALRGFLASIFRSRK